MCYFEFENDGKREQHFFVNGTKLLSVLCVLVKSKRPDVTVWLGTVPLTLYYILVDVFLIFISTLLCIR